MKKAMTTVAAATLAVISVGAVAAENSLKLSGSEIRARFAGMQLTDEVHWRDVYERDGSLRSYTFEEGSWQMGGRERRAMSLFQGTGRWLLRSVALGGPH
jgi:hypothetical protein